LLWKVAWDILHSRAKIGRLVASIDLAAWLCPFYKSPLETLAHIFLECDLLDFCGGPLLGLFPFLISVLSLFMFGFWLSFILWLVWAFLRLEFGNFNCLQLSFWIQFGDAGIFLSMKGCSIPPPKSSMNSLAHSIITLRLGESLLFPPCGFPLLLVG
jgi:hypothetical protein